MTQVFEQEVLTSDSLPAPKKPIESIIREWVINQCECHKGKMNPLYIIIKKIQSIADENSFKAENNHTMLEILSIYGNDDNPLFETVVNNRYTFSVNGVVLRYTPAGIIDDTRWQIVQE